MGLFNNEIEKKAGPDPSVVMPQSLPAHAVPVPPPTRPDASRVPMPHQSTHAQTVGARAYLDQGSKISGKLKFEGPVQIDGQVDGEISAKDRLMIGESAVVTAQINASSIIVAGRWIATMDKSAPLPSLQDQTPTWAKAAALAKEWELNHLTERLDTLAKRG